MDAIATLRVMSYGKWSDRFGGADQPYEYVDLYDAATGEMFTWSLDETLGDDSRPALNSESDVIFDLRKQAKPALTKIKKGDNKGDTIEYVAEKLKVKVTAFAKAGQGQRVRAAAEPAKAA